MLLLLLIGVGISTGPVRAYAAISFSVVDGGALALSLVNSSGMSIRAVDDAEGSVS